MSTWISLLPPRSDLRLPLRSRWRSDPGLGYMDLVPQSDGNVVVVASLAHVAGLSLLDGSALWTHKLSAPASDMASTRLGPVTVHRDGTITQLTSLSWEGTLLWRARVDMSVGADSLRGFSDDVLVKGLPLERGSRGTCRRIDAATGKTCHDYPCEGDGAPDVVPRGLVTSVRAPDTRHAGLFLLDVVDDNRVRLLPDSHSVRAVSGSVVVVDTWDKAVAPRSRMIAVDSDGEEVLWNEEGGPCLALDADDRQVVGVVAKAEGGFAAVLRDLRTGEPAWRSDTIEGTYATTLLVPDAVLVFAEGARLHVFDRAKGTLVQTEDEPSTLVRRACLTSGAVVDVCAAEVRCWSGARD